MKWKLPWPRYAKGGTYARFAAVGDEVPALLLPGRSVQDVPLPPPPAPAAAYAAAGMPPPWPAPPEGPEWCWQGDWLCARPAGNGHTDHIPADLSEAEGVYWQDLGPALPEGDRDDPREAVAKAIADSDGWAWDTASEALKEEFRNNADAVQAVLRSRSSRADRGIVDRLREEKERAEAERENFRATIELLKTARRQALKDRNELRDELERRRIAGKGGDVSATLDGKVLELKNARKSLEEARDELRHLRGEKEDVSASLDATHTELVAAKANEKALRAELKAAREACQAMREERDAARGDGPRRYDYNVGHSKGYSKGFQDGALSERRTASRVKGERE